MTRSIRIGSDDFEPDKDLMEAPNRAEKYTQTPELARGQKTSFAMGMMGFGSTVTRDQVTAVLDKLEGRD